MNNFKIDILVTAVCKYLELLKDPIPYPCPQLSPYPVYFQAITFNITTVWTKPSEGNFNWNYILYWVRKTMKKTHKIKKNVSLSRQKLSKKNRSFPSLSAHLDIDKKTTPLSKTSSLFIIILVKKHYPHCISSVKSFKRKKRKTQYTYLSVFVDMATIPSGHCSDAKLDAYSSDSYESGVKWKRDWYV